MKNTKPLEEGDVIEIKDGHEIYAVVPEHFLYESKKGCFKLVCGSVTVGGELSYLGGIYVVQRVSEDGEGPSSYGLAYGKKAIDNESGRRVYCVNESSGREISFFQTGKFRPVIKDIEPIGKARLKWCLPDGHETGGPQSAPGFKIYKDFQ